MGQASDSLTYENVNHCEHLSVTDTIISWTDPEVATDLALSFQETMGCTFIWYVHFLKYLLFKTLVCSMYGVCKTGVLLLSE